MLQIGCRWKLVAVTLKCCNSGIGGTIPFGAERATEPGNTGDWQHIYFIKGHSIHWYVERERPSLESSSTCWNYPTPSQLLRYFLLMVVVYSSATPPQLDRAKLYLRKGEEPPGFVGHHVLSGGVGSYWTDDAWNQLVKGWILAYQWVRVSGFWQWPFASR